jgi:hypothetical protein
MVATTVTKINGMKGDKYETKKIKNGGLCNNKWLW